MYFTITIRAFRYEHPQQNQIEKAKCKKCYQETTKAGLYSMHKLGTESFWANTIKKKQFFSGDEAVTRPKHAKKETGAIKSTHSPGSNEEAMNGTVRDNPCVLNVLLAGSLCSFEDKAKTKFMEKAISILNDENSKTKPSRPCPEYEHISSCFKNLGQEIQGKVHVTK